MKNIYRRIASMFAVAFVAAMSLTMVGCSEDEVVEPARLATPDVDVIYRSESFDATWKAVEGADGYVYSFDNGAEQTITDTKISVSGLAFGSSHTLKIKAVDSSNSFAASEWNVINMTLNTAFTLGEITLSISQQTASSFVISWNAAEGAEYYEVALGSGAVEKVTGLQKEFSGLAEGVYAVKVRPATSDADYAEAPWVSINAKTQETISDELAAANSLLIEEAGAYVFAPFKGNSAEAVEGVAGAALLWQDTPGLITEVSLVDSKVRFVVADGVYGNAVVCAYGAAGTSDILWSWHIWVPSEKVESLPMITGFNVMSMNLGALNSVAGDVNGYGLHYQWGRKDPFTGSPVLTGTTTTLAKPIYNIDGEEGAFTSVFVPQTVDFTIANPTIFVSPGKDYDDWCSVPDSTLWGNGEGHVREGLKYYNLGEKSMYDPCPAGWRVPPIMAFSKFTSTGAAVMGNYGSTAVADRNGDGVVDTNDYNYGYYFTLAGTTTSFFPAATRWYGAYGLLYGSVAGHLGVYWSNSIYKSTLGSQKDSKMATACLNFMSPTAAGTCFVSACAGGGRSDASSVRCVADKE